MDSYPPPPPFTHRNTALSLICRLSISEDSSIKVQGGSDTVQRTRRHRLSVEFEMVQVGTGVHQTTMHHSHTFHLFVTLSLPLSYLSNNVNPNMDEYIIHHE